MVCAKNSSFILILALVVCVSLKMVNGQSRCDAACANDSSCRSGLCSLSKCSDSGTCYEFCLRCAGIETCYASGDTCKSTGFNFGFNGFSSSNNLKYSISLLVVTTASFILFSN